MKQTAVEWLIEKLKNVEYNPLQKNGYSIAEERLYNQAKEIENQQQDELAIEFAEWCDSKTTQVSKGEWANWIHDAKNCFSSKELLEKFKKK